jgi:hypothetical protein
MSRGAQTLRQGDVTKAIKGAVKAGLSVKRFEVDKNGKIIVFTGEVLPSAATGNEWDNIR